jgi:hypothetical protein
MNAYKGGKKGAVWVVQCITVGAVAATDTCPSNIPTDDNFRVGIVMIIDDTMFIICLCSLKRCQDIERYHYSLHERLLGHHRRKHFN